MASYFPPSCTKAVRIGKESKIDIVAIGKVRAQPYSLHQMCCKSYFGVALFPVFHLLWAHTSICINT
jgi:hypothetical protein